MTEPFRAGTTVAAADLLEAILAATRRLIAVRTDAVPAATLEAKALGRRPRGAAFTAALGRAGRINLIAECKRRSPSKGVLQADYDPAAIARGYVRGGAVAVSVLTEPTFFDGAGAHLEAVRAAVDVPVLRKDFILSEYQLLEACAWGADAVLLIVAALEPDRLAELSQRASALGLATLVEVHDEAELDRALAAGASVIGVNNRNLRTLDVCLDTSVQLSARMPSGVVAVVESGLKRHADLTRLQGAGYSAFLVGEGLMARGDPERAVRDLLGADRQGEPT